MMKTESIKNLVGKWRNLSGVAFFSKNYSAAKTTGVVEPVEYIPRRAMMYVPGNDWKKINKIPSMIADSFIIDCEDGVALNRKEEARNNIHKIFNEEIFKTELYCELGARVNSIESGLCEIDLETVLKGPNTPSTLLLPKLETKAQLDWLAQKLDSFSKNKSIIRLIVFIESARSLLDMDKLLQHCFTLQEKGAPFSLEAVIFGSDDFSADIGASRTPEARELIYSRQHFLTVAKAHRLQAIDLVYINFKDEAGLLRQSIEGAEMGFTGKQVIHPSQIDIVQKAFTPSEDRIRWANDLTQAFNAHQQSGKGAFTFHGHMIDMPLLLQAKKILEIVDRLQKHPLKS